MEKHASLAQPKKSHQTVQLDTLAEYSIETIKELTVQFERMKNKFRELKEVDLTVSTVADLVSKMDGLESKFDTFINNMGLNREVLEKESKILDKIGALVEVQ